MPGYGVSGPEHGTGLLHWSWAAERLTAARNYWVASVWPDGRPHTMPVWGMWDDSTLWFTSAADSRKVKNLRHDPRCCVTTEDASDPVIIEGVARFVTDTPTLQRVVDLMNAKYHSGVDLDFLQPGEERDDRRPPPARVLHAAQRLHRLADPLGVRRGVTSAFLRQLRRKSESSERTNGQSRR